MPTNRTTTKPNAAPTRGPDRALTPKQATFVREYLLDLNAAAAARRAGFSAQCANVMGSQLLAKPHIRAAVDQAMAERTLHTGVKAELVIERLWHEAHGKGPDTTSAARISALSLLGRHVGMFTDKVEIHGNATNLAVPVAELTVEQRRQRLAFLQAKRSAEEQASEGKA